MNGQENVVLSRNVKEQHASVRQTRKESSRKSSRTNGRKTRETSGSRRESNLADRQRSRLARCSLIVCDAGPSAGITRHETDRRAQLRNFRVLSAEFGGGVKRLQKLRMRSRRQRGRVRVVRWAARQRRKRRVVTLSMNHAVNDKVTTKVYRLQRLLCRLMFGFIRVERTHASHRRVSAVSCTKVDSCPLTRVTRWSPTDDPLSRHPAGDLRLCSRATRDSHGPRMSDTGLRSCVADIAAKHAPRWYICGAAADFRLDFAGLSGSLRRI